MVPALLGSHDSETRRHSCRRHCCFRAGFFRRGRHRQSNRSHSGWNFPPDRHASPRWHAANFRHPCESCRLLFAAGRRHFLPSSRCLSFLRRCRHLGSVVACRTYRRRRWQNAKTFLPRKCGRQPFAVACQIFRSIRRRFRWHIANHRSPNAWRNSVLTNAVGNSPPRAARSAACQHRTHRKVPTNFAESTRCRSRVISRHGY